MRTFPVIDKAHLRLAKANGILSAGDAIVNLKLALIDALTTRMSTIHPIKVSFVTHAAGKVHGHGLDPDIFWSGRRHNSQLSVALFFSRAISWMIDAKTVGVLSVNSSWRNIKHVKSFGISLSR